MFLVQDLKGLGYEKGKPVGLVGVTELSDAQKKQLKEQQEVRPWGAGEAGSIGTDGVLSHPTLWCSSHGVFFLSLPVPDISHTGERLLHRQIPVNGMPPLRTLLSPQLGPEPRPSHTPWVAPAASAAQLLPTALVGCSQLNHLQISFPYSSLQFSVQDRPV